MIVSINYADGKYKETQRYNTRTAYQVGKVDKVIEYGPENIDAEFKIKCKIALEAKRGAGYWIWKPYIMNKSLQTLNNGDYLVYCDSGAFYRENIKFLIDFMNEHNENILCFEIPFIECEWTKEEIFKYLNCNNFEMRNSLQRWAGIVIIKKSNFSLKFFEEYYKIAIEKPILFTDNASENNCNNFKECRHDQSVFSVLTKKYNIKAYRDPTEFGKNPKLYGKEIMDEKNLKLFYQKSKQYPVMFSLHREKSVTFKTKIKIFLRMFLPGYGYYYFNKLIQKISR